MWQLISNGQRTITQNSKGNDVSSWIERMAFIAILILLAVFFVLSRIELARVGTELAGKERDFAQYIKFTKDSTRELDKQLTEYKRAIGRFESDNRERGETIRRLKSGIAALEGNQREREKLYSRIVDENKRLRENIARAEKLRREVERIVSEL